MKITVTQEHIDQGVPRNAMRCPVALACFGQGVPVYNVDLFTGPSHEVVSIIRLTDGRDINLPFHVTVNILRFDIDLNIEPFTFDLPYEQE